MSEITWKKKALKHPAAKKAKRMLTKLIKDSVNVSCHFCVSGNQENDCWQLEYHAELEMKRLHDRIGKEIEEQKEYKNGYSISQHIERANFVKGMYDIYHFVANNYYRYEKDFEIEINIPSEEKIVLHLEGNSETPIGESMGG